MAAGEWLLRKTHSDNKFANKKPTQNSTDALPVSMNRGFSCKNTLLTHSESVHLSATGTLTESKKSSLAPLFAIHSARLHKIAPRQTLVIRITCVCAVYSSGERNHW